jgi:hypothetical protein
LGVKKPETAACPHPVFRFAAFRKRCKAATRPPSMIAPPEATPLRSLRPRAVVAILLAAGTLLVLSSRARGNRQLFDTSFDGKLGEYLDGKLDGAIDVIASWHRDRYPAGDKRERGELKRRAITKRHAAPRALISFSVTGSRFSWTCKSPPRRAASASCSTHRRTKPLQ